MKALSVIIVNYKAPQLLINCLATLFRETTGIPFEVIVVDNASGDDSRERVLQQFPSAVWIDMPYNAGFARANNTGLKSARGDVFLLLNSDTLIQDMAVENCYREFIRSNYVACGVQLVNSDGTPQISGNYFMKGGLNYLLPLPYIGNAVKAMGTFTKVKKPHVPDASTETEVDWINGAFLMVKKTAVEKAGLLDEDFFLYSEEAEWCSRLRTAGRLCIYGQYRIVHLQGETANEVFASTGKGYSNLTDRKGLQIMLSTFVRIRKQFGVVWYLFHLLTYTIAVPVYFTGSLIENLFKLRNPFSEFRHAASYAANVARLWRYIFPIVRNKPYFYKVL